MKFRVVIIVYCACIAGVTVVVPWSGKTAEGILVPLGYYPIWAPPSREIIVAERIAERLDAEREQELRRAGLAGALLLTLELGFAQYEGSEPDLSQSEMEQVKQYQQILDKYEQEKLKLLGSGYQDLLARPRHHKYARIDTQRIILEIIALSALAAVAAAGLRTRLGVRD